MEVKGLLSSSRLLKRFLICKYCRIMLCFLVANKELLCMISLPYLSRYRGMFDKRPVAIKRILPECFDLADKEVGTRVFVMSAYHNQ